MTTTRRHFLSVCMALGAGIGLYPSHISAKPPAKPPNKAPARAKPRPRPPKPVRVKATPKVKQMTRRDISRGARIANPSVKRPEAKSHPYRHGPMNRRVLRDKARARLKSKQKSGARLPQGVTYSSFKDRRTINHSIGYAHKHYQGPIKALKNRQKVDVVVPYSKPIGTVYNTKTNRFRSGSESVVRYRRDAKGIYVETVFVR